MLSPRHEAAAKMLNDAPSVIVSLLTGGLGVSLPAHDDLRVEPGVTWRTLWPPPTSTRASSPASTSTRAGSRAGEAAEAVIEVLEARGIEVPAADRAHITACQDIEQLTTWIRRAATAESVDDLFR